MYIRTNTITTIPFASNPIRLLCEHNGAIYMYCAVRWWFNWSAKVRTVCKTVRMAFAFARANTDTRSANRRESSNTALDCAIRRWFISKGGLAAVAKLAPAQHSASAEIGARLWRRRQQCECGGCGFVKGNRNTPNQWGWITFDHIRIPGVCIQLLCN